MTSTPQEPLDEPVDTAGQDVEGQDVEGQDSVGDGNDFIDKGTLRGSPGDEGNR